MWKDWSGGEGSWELSGKEETKQERVREIGEDEWNSYNRDCDVEMWLYVCREAEDKTEEIYGLTQVSIYLSIKVN